MPTRRSIHCRLQRFRGGYRQVALVAALACAASGAVCGADGFARVVSAANVDTDASKAFLRETAKNEPKAAHELPLPKNGIPCLVGDSSDCRGMPWPLYAIRHGPSHPLMKAPEAAYRFCFREAASIGSTRVRLGQAEGEAELYALKAGAPYPGDPWNDAHWEILPARTAGGALWAVLPAKAKTRALLLRHRGFHHSGVQQWQTFAGRFQDVTAEALAQAERYIGGSPAANLVRGYGWTNANPDTERGDPRRRPVTDVDPSWAILSYPEPQTLDAVWMEGNAFKVRTYGLKEGVEGNPALLGKEAWRNLRAEKNGPMLTLRPTSARSIKFVIEGLKEERANAIDLKASKLVIPELRLFENLEDRPAREIAEAGDDDPPFRIPYELDRAGEFCLAVDDGGGHRVQNLVAQVKREPGAYKQPWDLKGIDGEYVEPGAYKAKGVIGPPPEVRYVTSVYPNVPVHSPMNSAWLNGHSGPGGWLADHSGNSCGAAHGDHVFIGAWCAESGVALIELDQDGHKIWGRHNLMAWTGPQRMASDGENLYVGVHKSDGDTIWRIDGERETHGFLSLRKTPERHNGLRGMAVVDGKLVLSIVSPNRKWLQNAFAAADVDLDKAWPAIPTSESGGREEDLPNPRGHFLGLLRLTGSPTGHPHKGGKYVYMRTGMGKGRKQHILVPFKKPVPVGTLVFPPLTDEGTSLRLSLLKPDAPFPPNIRDESQWTRLDVKSRGVWDTATAPPGTETRALRISFVRGGEDDLADIDDAMNAPADGGLGTLDMMGGGGGGGGLDGGGESWEGRLEGLKILRRRYENLFYSAKVRVNSGTVDENGVWDARRSEPLSERKPGVYVMEWETPQEVRGLAIKEIDGYRTEIDILTDGDGALDIEADKRWKHVATYKQQRRFFYQPAGNRSPLARYVDGYVDLGPDVKTRAIRLRVVEQWMTNEGRPHGVREDRGGTELDPTRCRVYGVAPLKYLGGEQPTDPLTTVRLETRSLKDASLLSEHDIQAWELRAGPDGNLYGMVEGGIGRIDLSTNTAEVLPLEMEKLGAFDFDSEGNLYVYDKDPAAKVIRVFDKSGKPLRTIGTPGGWRAGKWDPTRLDHVQDLVVDAQDRVWVVESSNTPKRVTLWAKDGSFVREYLGNTEYGGGGILDRFDKSLIRYGPLQFRIDWETGQSKLESLLYHNPDVKLGGHSHDLFPVRYEGRDYLVTRVGHPWGDAPISAVFLREGDTARCVAAFGQGTGFNPLLEERFAEKMGSQTPRDVEFTYFDRNGDGAAQPEEVTLAPSEGEHWQKVNFYGVDHDLGVFTNRLSRYVVKEVLSNGTPIYEEKPSAALKTLRARPDVADVGYCRLLRNGEIFVTFSRAGRQRYNGVVTPDGELRWSYPIQHEGVTSLQIYPWRPGWVVHQFVMGGNEAKVPGELGPVFMMTSNCGQWNLWTADGLLAAQIYLHKQNPEARLLNFREHDRGMLWENLTMGQEHFSGSMTLTEEDGKLYVVCGHNHVSIAELKGWDRFKRLEETVEVTREDLDKTRAWEIARAKRDVYVRAPLIRCGPGEVKSIGEHYVAQVGGDQHYAQLFLCRDKENLYVQVYAKGMGVFENTGNDWKVLYKSGAAVDLKFGTDPAADPDRNGPAAGDLRLVLAQVKGEPVAVLYRPVAPGAPADQKWEMFTTAAGKIEFDQVRKAPEVQMRHEEIADRGVTLGYRLTAAIPLKLLGLEPTPDLQIRFDWGLLISDTGDDVRSKVYWANTLGTGTADAVMEARLHPGLWGYLRFVGEKKSFLEKHSVLDAGADPEAKSEDEILDELDM